MAARLPAFELDRQDQDLPVGQGEGHRPVVGIDRLDLDPLGDRVVEGHALARHGRHLGRLRGRIVPTASTAATSETPAAQLIERIVIGLYLAKPQRAGQ